MHELDLFLPRSAFTPREVARAGDLWRAFQDVAVAGSIAAGWDPARYRREKVSFIVRQMVVLHHRETIYGETLRGRTWPSQFKRGMFFRRECRLGAPDGPVASATQEWVHVTADLELARAADALVDAFAVEAHEPPIELPAIMPLEGRWHAFELECWSTWMDPLDHVNHPAYVDFCDEGLCRAMGSAGLDPVRLVPVGERVTFRAGLHAGERATVRTRLSGRTADGALAFEHVVEAGEKVCAKATTLRRLAADGDADADASDALLRLA